MKPHRFVVTVTAMTVAIGMSGGASQSVLPKVGLTVKDLQAWATAAVTNTTNSSNWIRQEVPCLTPATLKAIQGLGAAERLTLTQEVLTALKAAVSTPAYRAEHVAFVRKTRGGVDHGIDVNTYGTSGNMDADMIKFTVVPMIEMIRTFPADALRQAFEDERTEQREAIKNETGEERAKAQKHLARLDALAPLMKTNFEEFRKQYTLAKSASMGGPETEAQLKAMAGSRDDTEKIRLEQSRWNSWNLNVMIRKSLTEYIKLAGSTTFTKEQYFCDAFDSTMTGLDGLMHLMGAGPSNRAAQFAKTWLTELGN